MRKLMDYFTKNMDMLLCLSNMLLSLLIIYNFRNNLTNMVLQIGLLLGLGSLFYLFIRAKLLKSQYEVKPELINRRLSIFFVSFNFWLIIALAICYYTMHLSLSLSIFISAIVGIMAAEILLIGPSLLLLLQIILIALLHRAIIFFEYPSPVGNDPWTHTIWIFKLISTGYVYNSLGGYSSTPIFHIFASIISQITSLNIKDTLFIVGSTTLFSVIFLYIIISYYFDKRIALLSCLLICFSSYHIATGTKVIAQTLCVAILPILLYLVFYYNNKFKIYLKSMIILYLIFIVLTHTLSSFVFLVIVTSIWLAGLFESLPIYSPSKNYAFLSIGLVIFFLVLLIGYWMYCSGFIGFVTSSIKWGFSQAYLAPSPTTIRESSLDTFIKNLPVYILILSAMIGSYYSIAKRFPISVTSYGWGIVSLVAFSIIFQAGDILPGRWFDFLQIAIALPMSIGIMQVIKLSNRKCLIIFFIIFSITFVSITNYNANIRNVNPLTPYPTHGLKESDLAASIRMMKNSPLDYPVFCDNFGTRYYGLYQVMRNDKTKRMKDGTKILSGLESIIGTILVRKEVENNVFLSPSGGKGHLSVVRLSSEAKQAISKASRIYDNGADVSIVVG